jgi:glycosyltransferase involved in cell wall biosynthesis
MASMEKTPFFSIIMCTRNRPEIFQTALRSVLEQSFLDREIIVVIDGSTDSNLTRYRALQPQLTGISFFELEQRQNGHGQSYALNYGVDKSCGKYLCFLDDDDKWTDNEYLTRLFESLSAAKKPVEVHYSHQKAIYSDGGPQLASVWIEDLIPKVKPQDRNHGDTYFVDLDFLLSSSGFAHLNCSVFERNFYCALKGMDESIRYENDRDIYLRAIDAARTILFSTRYVSLHNIPDVSKKDNMSTVSTDIEKKLYQMRVYDKGISQSTNSRLVRYCCKAKIYELKHAAHILAGSRQYGSAAHYAKSALISGFNFRWLAYTVYLILQARIKPQSASGEGVR